MLDRLEWDLHIGGLIKVKTYDELVKEFGQPLSRGIWNVERFFNIEESTEGIPTKFIGEVYELIGIVGDYVRIHHRDIIGGNLSYYFHYKFCYLIPTVSQALRELLDD